MRRIVALSIRGYRRWLSGRGPLHRVRCTFEGTESCSAYGLRAVEELSTSLPHAIQLVRARIRACRCTSIYRFENGLGWERDHEQSPVQLVDTLAGRGERPETIAQVLAARTMVARWRGDRASYFEATQLRLPQYAPSHARPATNPIPIRAGDAAIERYRRAMRRGLLLAVAALVACWFTMLAVVPLAFAMLAVQGALDSARRLETQRVAATFLRPDPTAAHRAA